MPKGSPGFDAYTRTHVEGHASAIMQRQGISEGLLYETIGIAPDVGSVQHAPSDGGTPYLMAINEEGSDDGFTEFLAGRRLTTGTAFPSNCWNAS